MLPVQPPAGRVRGTAVLGLSDVASRSLAAVDPIHSGVRLRPSGFGGISQAYNFST